MLNRHTLSARSLNAAASFFFLFRQDTGCPLGAQTTQLAGRARSCFALFLSNVSLHMRVSAWARPLEASKGCM